jgi:hypothetical protein
MAKIAGNQGIFLKNLLNIEKKVVRVKNSPLKTGLGMGMKLGGGLSWAFTLQAYLEPYEQGDE